MIADPIDRGTAEAQNTIDTMVEAHVNRERPQQQTHCARCNDEIPTERQKATGGTNTCVDCAI